jgi:hypothetical protein
MIWSLLTNHNHLLRNQRRSRNPCCRYYNDTWQFNIEELSWEALETSGSSPAPRGGCQLALHGDTMFVVGGHSVVWEGGGEQDKVHDDVWALCLKTLQVCFFVLFPKLSGAFFPFL